jgi:hypothetical protein
MATRSRIGILNKDGSILAHYCHSDGYFSHNGRLLHDHWTDRKQIQKLGDMSVLGEVIGKKHDFNWMDAILDKHRKAGTDGWEEVKADARNKMCLFYKRDRAEKGDLAPKLYASIDEFIASGDAEEYLYVYDDNRACWLGCATPYQCTAADLQWHLLSDLHAAEWEDGRDDDGNNPKVRVVPLVDDALADAIAATAPTAANDDEDLDVDDPAARAMF